MAETILNPDVVRITKRSASKSLTDVQVTPVVLVCIYNQNSTVITHDILFKAFCNYGRILRILLFEKMKIWKAFVEYDNLDSAMEAKRNLNNFLLFDDGTRINVYYSNIQTIRFQNNNSGGKDYTLESDGESHLDSDQPSQSQAFSKTAPNQSLVNALAGYREQSLQNQPFSKTAPNLSSALAGFNAFNNGGGFSSSKSSHQSMRGGIFDDQENDILEIINECHDESPYNEQLMQNQLQDEEIKADLEDADGDIYAQFFPDAFKKVPVPVPEPESSKSSNSRAKNLSNLSLRSQPFGQLGANPQQQVWQQPDDQQTWQQIDDQQIWAKAPENLKSATFPQYAGLANQLISGDVSKSASFPQQSVLKQKVTSPVYAQKAIHTPPKNPPGIYNFEETTSPNPPNRQFAKLPSYNSMENIPNNFAPKYQQNTYPNQAINTNGTHQYNSHGFPVDQRQAPESYYVPQNETLATNEATGAGNTNSGGSEYDGLMDLIEKDILREKNNPSNNINTKGNNLKGLLQQCTTQPGGKGLDKMNIVHLNQLYSELTSLLKTREDEKKSQVLYIKGLESREITVQMLVNIFGNFGNVTKIVLVRSRASALVEYENDEYSALAKNHLENISFLGSSLKIHYSSYSITGTKTSGSCEEVYIGNPKTFKFNKKKMATVNPPSPAIRISNLARDACREDIIRNRFGAYGRVETVKVAFVENKCTCSVKMGSVAESLLVIAHVNDTEFYGRKVRISFNRSKM